MSRRALAVPLMLCAALQPLSLLSFGQITNTSPVGVTGIVTNQLTTPLPPSVSSVTTSCTAGTGTYTYAVAALDVTGASTTAATSSTTGCKSLTTSTYNAVTIAPVLGAASCNVYRTAVPSGTGYPTGLLANVPCASAGTTGATVLDTMSSLLTNSLPVPGSNTTGGIMATMVTAQSFNANGSGVGTEILNSGTTGTVLNICSTTVGPPCIPSSGAFFQQAPPSFGGTSLGITWPSTFSPISGMFYGPFLLVTSLGANGAAPVSIGTLTDSGNSRIASASGSFANTGDLVSVLLGTGTVDFVDSGITLSGSQIPVSALSSSTTMVNGNSCTLGGTTCTVTLDQLGPLSNNATNTALATFGWTLAGTPPPQLSGTGTPAGTLFAVTAPQGGGTNGSSVAAGQGGLISFTSGTGGAVGTGGSNDTGGPGGDISITASAGGSGASGTSSSGGRGGNITLSAGAGGANSTGGTVGLSGTIVFQQQGQPVFSTTNTGQTSIFSAATTGQTTVQGGTDTNASAATLGAILIRGADVTGGTTSGSVAGAATIQGGDNASAATSGTLTAGNLTIRPGAATGTGGATQTNGKLVVEITAIKGTTYTAGNLGCITGVATVGDCTSGSNNQMFVGVNQSNSGYGNTAIVAVLGVTVVNSNMSTTFTAGHLACTDTANAGKMIDGGAGPTCSSGVKVGTILATDTSSNQHVILITQ
jgi:hypothetical protein